MITLGPSCLFIAPKEKGGTWHIMHKMGNPWPLCDAEEYSVVGFKQELPSWDNVCEACQTRLAMLMIEHETDTVVWDGPGKRLDGWRVKPSRW